MFLAAPAALGAPFPRAVPAGAEPGPSRRALPTAIAAPGHSRDLAHRHHASPLVPGLGPRGSPLAGPTRLALKALSQSGGDGPVEGSPFDQSESSSSERGRAPPPALVTAPTRTPPRGGMQNGGGNEDSRTEDGSGQPKAGSRKAGQGSGGRRSRVFSLPEGWARVGDPAGQEAPKGVKKAKGASKDWARRRRQQEQHSELWDELWGTISKPQPSLSDLAPQSTPSQRNTPASGSQSYVGASSFMALTHPSVREAVKGGGGGGPESKSRLHIAAEIGAASSLSGAAVAQLRVANLLDRMQAKSRFGGWSSSWNDAESPEELLARPNPLGGSQGAIDTPKAGERDHTQELEEGAGSGPAVGPTAGESVAAEVVDAAQQRRIEPLAQAELGSPAAPAAEEMEARWAMVYAAKAEKQGTRARPEQVHQGLRACGGDAACEVRVLERAGCGHDAACWVALMGELKSAGAHSAVLQVYGRMLALLKTRQLSAPTAVPFNIALSSALRLRDRSRGKGGRGEPDGAGHVGGTIAAHGANGSGAHAEEGEAEDGFLDAGAHALRVSVPCQGENGLAADETCARSADDRSRTEMLEVAPGPGAILHDMLSHSVCPNKATLRLMLDHLGEGKRDPTEAATALLALLEGAGYGNRTTLIEWMAQILFGRPFAVDRLSAGVKLAIVLGTSGEALSRYTIIGALRSAQELKVRERHPHVSQEVSQMLQVCRQALHEKQVLTRSSVDVLAEASGVKGPRPLMSSRWSRTRENV